MKIIHAIIRKPLPAEKRVLMGDQIEAQLTLKRQRNLIVQYLTGIGFEIEDIKGVPRINKNEEYYLSWKTLRGEGGNTKFGETAIGVRLFKPMATSEQERNMRFEKGDWLITSQYDILFGDHPSHSLKIIADILCWYKGKFIICDLGEIDTENKEGKILLSVLSTMAKIRFEKASEMNRKSKRMAKDKNQFIGGKRTPFGTEWKSFSDGSTYKLTQKDLRLLNKNKSSFGKYTSVFGELVPNKMEQEAVKLMRKLRRKKVGGKPMSYMKISKKVKEYFGTNNETGEPNISISHTGVYRILNPGRKPNLKKINILASSQSSNSEGKS